MKYIPAYSSIIVVIFTILLLGCANQLPPEGGPVDMTAPVIVSTYPKSNALYFNDNVLRFEFDRYIDERTFEESIFISPYVGTLEFDWSGTEVEITFPEKLHRNTTYVVNIGTDVIDKYRGQTRMAKAFTIAFSTGNDIDRGGIEGFVFPRKQSDNFAGIMIFAYQLDAINPDTLNPLTAQPDFITQTGKGGDFFLYHIPLGSYRIFAIRDEFRNLVYDREVDEYGVPSHLIRLTPNDTLETGVLMQLAIEDTSGPRIVKASAIDRHHIVAEFSEALSPTSISPSSLTIIDTISRIPLDLVAVYPDPSTPKSIIAITQKQDSTRGYLLQVENVTDTTGNKVHPSARSYVFTGSAKVDTTGFRFVASSIKDSVQGIDLQPVITLTVSNASAKTTSLDFINILDQRKQQVQTEKKWMSPVMISIEPKQLLSSKMWYSLHANLYNLFDWEGHRCRDSIQVRRFETLDIEDRSRVEGRVLDSNKTDTQGNLYVTAVQTTKDMPSRFITVVDAAGNFTFPIVTEGQYVFQAFRDRNQNGLYDAGKPFPFIYSERLSSLTDTLNVRARWPLEGVTILLK